MAKRWDAGGRSESESIECGIIVALEDEEAEMTYQMCI